MKYKSYVELANNALSQGIASGIQKFLIARSLVDRDDTKNNYAVSGFTLAFIGEFDDKPEIYPFKDSFKAFCDASMGEVLSRVKELWDNKEYENAEKLARTIFYGETLLFLDARAGEAITVWNAIKATQVKA